MSAGAPLILVVEDDPEIAALLVAALGDEGYQVLTAGKGEAALDLAARHHPALVTMDMLLPGELDGLETTRALRAAPATARVPIVALSALYMAPAHEAAYAAGVSAYLDKPFALAEVLAAVKSLLAAPPGREAR